MIQMNLLISFINTFVERGGKMSNGLSSFSTPFSVNSVNALACVEKSCLFHRL